MQKTTRLNRLLAVIVAVFMVVCCLPLNAFAEPVDKAVVTVNYVADGEVKGSEQIEVGFEAATKTATISMSKLKEMLKNKPAAYDFDESQANETFTVSIDKFELSTGWSASKPIEVKVVSNVKPTRKIIVNFNNGDGTWTDGVADSDAKQFVLSSDTPDATYTVPADVQAPNGKVLSNWTNNWDSSVLNAGDTFSYNSIAAIVGNTEAESYIAFTAQYKDAPAPVEKKIIVNFNNGDGTWTDGVADGDAKQFVLSSNTPDATYTVPADVQAPNGKVLSNWTNNWDSSVLNAGDTFSYNSIVAIVGNTEAESYIAYTAQYVDKPDEGLKKIDVVFVTADGKEVGGHYTLEPGQTNFVYDSVYEGACPEGQMLDHWYLNGDQSKVYATGASVTFEQLAAVIGDGYDAKGVAYISFSPAFVATKTVGLNFFDEANYEQVEERYIEIPEYANNVSTNKIQLPDGYEFTVTGDLAINDGWVYVGVKCVKTLRIFWAVDNKDASFANGNEDSWTQELTWKHVNDDITMPEIDVPDGYVLNGWSVNGQEAEFWKPSLKTMNVGDKYVADDNGGIISITANIVTKEQAESGSSDNNSNNNDTKTVSSNNNQVVKAETPADNTAKVMPQTGLTAETPVVFGVMMVAALAGAGAYLFAIRKKLN